MRIYIKATRLPPLHIASGQPSKTTHMRRKIKLALAGINAAGLIEKCGTLVTKLAGNANFPSPTPSIADLTTALTELTSATIAASRGDRELIIVRKDKERVVADMIRTLAGYITMTAEGDGAKIISSGFDLAKLPEPQPALSRPVSFKAERGRHTGEVELSWRLVRNAASYVVEMTTSDPQLAETKWTTAAITTKVKVKFADLNVGEFYYYRVKAIGRNSESIYSDISLVMTAVA